MWSRRETASPCRSQACMQAAPASRWLPRSSRWRSCAKLAGFSRLCLSREVLSPLSPPPASTEEKFWLQMLTWLTGSVILHFTNCSSPTIKSLQWLYKPFSLQFCMTKGSVCLLLGSPDFYAKSDQWIGGLKRWCWKKWSPLLLDSSAEAWRGGCFTEARQRSLRKKRNESPQISSLTFPSSILMCVWLEFFPFMSFKITYFSISVTFELPLF